jgi:hypothetical protein
MHQYKVERLKGSTSGDHRGSLPSEQLGVGLMVHMADQLLNLSTLPAVSMHAWYLTQVNLQQWEGVAES